MEGLIMVWCADPNDVIKVKKIIKSFGLSDEGSFVSVEPAEMVETKMAIYDEREIFFFYRTLDDILDSITEGG